MVMEEKIMRKMTSLIPHLFANKEKLLFVLPCWELQPILRISPMGLYFVNIVIMFAVMDITSCFQDKLNNQMGMM
eukprot:13029958-Ditylum_brightwellii.AAC.1